MTLDTREAIAQQIEQAADLIRAGHSDHSAAFRLDDALREVRRLVDTCVVDLIEEAEATGVRFEIRHGKLRLCGNRATLDLWPPALRKHRVAVLASVRARNEANR